MSRMILSEKTFLLAADSAPVMLWFTDANMQCIWLNTPWMEFTGTTMHTQEGWGWMNGVHPEDRVRVEDLVKLAMGSRQKFQVDYRLRHNTGQFRWVVSHGAPRYNEQQEFVGYVGSVTDIDERKETRIALELTNKRLEEADSRKNAFLAMLAHELRNPLAPIITAATILRGKPERADAMASLIERQTTQLKHLIDDLLDVSRITRGKITLSYSKFRVSEIVEMVMESILPRAQARNITIEQKLVGDNVLMEADKVRVVQVLSNLLDNAVKYSLDGTQVEFVTYVKQGAIEFCVSDEGEGIAPEMHEHVFELFTQASDGILGRSKGGLGVGLTVAREIVKLHGGSISVDSLGQGLGSTFKTRFPTYRPLALDRRHGDRRKHDAP